MAFFNVISNLLYGVHNPVGLKYLTRLRVGLSHLRDHKFKHKFRDTIHPFCSCNGFEFESVEHYLLHCPNHSVCRSVLFENLRKIISLVTLISSKYNCDLLIYGDPIYDITLTK